MTTAVGGIEASQIAGEACRAPVNAILGQCELMLIAAVGPRLVSIDDVAGAVCMMHRSEAGHPLRAFGGQ
ncbi:hypothetical protein [Methylobacterium nigriterrae]|uniref:hypothetical protein n=1 Tax=Methylobacterium nigriterrae TaxID=3127512 RepID=UPI00301367FE